MILQEILGIFLICFLSSYLKPSEATSVNRRALARIIRHIRLRYSPGGQFTVALNIPSHYCRAESSLDGSFLHQDKPDVVKAAVKRHNRLYEGHQLIAAKPKDAGHHNNKYHSEYLLLNPTNPGNSPMKDLMSKNPKGCLIFYTYNSPCKGTCLNLRADRNIVFALSMFNDHQGPKAFVYNRVFHNDNRDLEDFLTLINLSIPLYRCSYQDCDRCFSAGSISNKCLKTV